VATTYFCWFLPGFMGSELYGLIPDPSGRTPDQRIKLWLDPRRLISGETAQLLTLPTGPEMTVSPEGIVRDFYRPLLERFEGWRGRWLPEGWVYAPWSYDWRLGINENAAPLAERIRAMGGQDGTHMLVGHSMGGAVACAVWRALKAQGKEALIGRIVTIGGTLWGSYATARTWAGYDDTMNLLAYIRTPQFHAAFPFATLRAPNPHAFCNGALTAFVSWPSTYDLLPYPQRDDDPADTDRWITYRADTWPWALVQPNWQLMQQSLDGYHAQAHLIGQTPPPNVLKHIVGTGVATPWQIVDNPRRHAVPQPGFRWPNFATENAYRQSRMPTFRVGSGGDGRLSVTQAAIPGYPVATVDSEHCNLPNHPYVLENLPRILSDPLFLQASAPQVVPVPPAFPQYVPGRRTIQTAISIEEAEREPGRSIGEPAHGGPFTDPPRPPSDPFPGAGGGGPP